MNKNILAIVVAAVVVALLVWKMNHKEAAPAETTEIVEVAPAMEAAPAEAMPTEAVVEVVTPAEGEAPAAN